MWGKFSIGGFELEKVIEQRPSCWEQFLSVEVGDFRAITAKNIVLPIMGISMKVYSLIGSGNQGWDLDFSLMRT